jgi:hypothetical protein
MIIHDNNHDNNNNDTTNNKINLGQQDQLASNLNKKFI